MKFVLPLFHAVINLPKNFGINLMMFSYILNYMLYLLVNNYPYDQHRS
jgi:hypothetical protein